MSADPARTRLPNESTDADRVRVTFSTTVQVKALLDALVEQGLYGRNYHEAAERLVCEGIDRRIRQRLNP